MGKQQFNDFQTYSRAILELFEKTENNILLFSKIHLLLKFTPTNHSYNKLTVKFPTNHIFLGQFVNKSRMVKKSYFSNCSQISTTDLFHRKVLNSYICKCFQWLTLLFMSKIQEGNKMISSLSLLLAIRHPKATVKDEMLRCCH